MNGEAVVDLVEPEAHGSVGSGRHQLGAQNLRAEFLPLPIVGRPETDVAEFIYHESSPPTGARRDSEICFSLVITIGSNSNTSIAIVNQNFDGLELRFRGPKRRTE